MDNIMSGLTIYLIALLILMPVMGVAGGIYFKKAFGLSKKNSINE